MERQLPPHADLLAHGETHSSDDGSSDDGASAAQGKATRRGKKRKNGNKSQGKRDHEKAGSKSRQKRQRNVKADAAKVSRAAGEGVGTLVADWISGSSAEYVATILSLLNQAEIVESVLFGMLRTMHITQDFDLAEAKAAFANNKNVFFGGLLDCLDTAVQADKVGEHAYFVEQYLLRRKVLKERAALWRKTGKAARATLYVDVVEGECKETRAKCIGKTAWSTHHPDPRAVPTAEEKQQKVFFRGDDVLIHNYVDFIESTVPYTRLFLDATTLRANPSGPCAFLLDPSRDNSVPLSDSQRDLVYNLVESATRPPVGDVDQLWSNASSKQKEWDRAAEVLHIAYIDYTTWGSWEKYSRQIYDELKEQAAARKSWPRGANHSYEAESAVGLGLRNDQRGGVGIYRARTHKAVTLDAKQAEALLTLAEAGLGDFLHLLVEAPLSGIVSHGRDLTTHANILGAGWAKIATTLSVMVKFDARLHAEAATDPTFSYALVVNAKNNKNTTPDSCNFALPALDDGRGLVFRQKPGIAMAWAAKRLVHGSSWPWTPHSSPWRHWTEKDIPHDESWDDAPDSESGSESEFANSDDDEAQTYVPPPVFQKREGLRKRKEGVEGGKRSGESMFEEGDGPAMRLGGGAGPAGPRTRSMAKSGHRAGICAWQKVGMVGRAARYAKGQVDQAVKQAAERVVPEGRHRAVGRAFNVGAGVLPGRI